MESKLNDILHSVLHRFTYVSDQYQFGTREYWNEPETNGDFQGDCEDFALACRKQCRLADIPSRLVYCITEKGEGHCVLEVNGWILDNRHKWVIAQNELDYTWISISGFEPGDAWHEIKEQDND